MRNKSETNANIVRADLINSNKVVERVQNAFRHHRNTMEFPSVKGPTRIGITRMCKEEKAIKCSRNMRQTTGRCVIILKNKQLLEEWMRKAAKLLAQQEDIDMGDVEMETIQSHKRALTEQNK